MIFNISIEEIGKKRRTKEKDEREGRFPVIHYPHFSPFFRISTSFPNRTHESIFTFSSYHIHCHCSPAVNRRISISSVSALICASFKVYKYPSLFLVHAMHKYSIYCFCKFLMILFINFFSLFSLSPWMPISFSRIE